MSTYVNRIGLHARRGRGFTLIEVLVVLAIMALLVAILIPTLGVARGRARRLVCTANLHNIYVGLMMYKDSNGDRIPEWTTMGSWHFRRPPGMIDPDDPRSLPETYGLNALLSGVRPAERGTIRDRKIYLSAYSDVWRCPSAHAQMWERFRNTYAALKLTVPTGSSTGNIPTTNFSQLMLRGRRYENGRVWRPETIPLVQDNTGWGAGACGFRGADKWASAYPLPDYMKVTRPHAYGNKSGANAICILWLNGFVGVGGGNAGL